MQFALRFSFKQANGASQKASRRWLNPVAGQYGGTGRVHAGELSIAVPSHMRKFQHTL
jgi:hypothetical protein